MHIRHARCRGVRNDKSARAITREQAAPPTAPTPTPSARKTGTAIIHPDRVIDASTGLRKIDLVHYYQRVANRLLPHLKQRPVSLVRAPRGIAGQLFFQKHSEAQMPGVAELDAGLWPGHEALLCIAKPEGLVGADERRRVPHLELHRAPHGQADRLVFDPGDGVTWPQLQQAAQLGTRC